MEGNQSSNPRDLKALCDVIVEMCPALSRGETRLAVEYEYDEFRLQSRRIPDLGGLTCNDLDPSPWYHGAIMGCNVGSLKYYNIQTPRHSISLSLQ